MSRLFVEKRNIYFHLLTRLLSSPQQSFTRAELEAAFSDSGFTEYNYDFVRALTGVGNSNFKSLGLFEQRDEFWNYRLPTRPAIRLSSLEKQWLANMLEDELLSTVLPEPIADKLAAALGCKSALAASRNGVVIACIHAMLHNERLLCNNKTTSGIIFEKEWLIPHKLEYSLRTDAFWLIGYLPDKGKMVKMAVERMQVLQAVHNTEQVDIAALLECMRAPEPLIIEVEDKNRALERALLALSVYNREGSYIKQHEVYRIVVQYYMFDESELVRDVISLGKHVRIIGPSHVRHEVLCRIRQQIRLLQTN